MKINNVNNNINFSAIITPSNTVKTAFDYAEKSEGGFKRYFVKSVQHILND